jgi:AraC family transcriptional regulator
MGKRGLFSPDTLVIGVPHDNPDITPNARCRYDACVTVPDTVTDATGPVDLQALAGARYAVVQLDVADPAEIGQAVDELYGDWLPGSGYQTDDRPCLEIYHDAGGLGRIVLDFCVPIVPLGD